MNIGKARALFEQVASGEYHGSTVGEYLEAVRIILNMETHNSISKKMIISVGKWLVDVAEELVSTHRWIPVSERLPENRVCVLVCFREWQQYANCYIYSIVTGWYARKHSVRENVFSEWEADSDYDEDEDEYYIQEGWYEFTTQGNGDLMSWYIGAEVVAWMPLPEPYKPNKKQSGKEGA